MTGASGPPGPSLAADDVAVVVPVGGAAPAWARAARSLALLDPPPGEIVVVLDGANEEAAGTAAELGARLVELETRGGPARARNRGARATGRQIVLFVDSDVEVPADLAARIAAEISLRGGPAAVFGSYDDSPGDPGFLSQYRNLLHHYVHQTGRKEASTFWAGCGAVRRDAFDEVGGFDERFGEPSIEDIELGARLIGSGHPIRLAGEIQVKHLKRWRLTDMLATDLFRRAVPWTRLMLAQGGLVNDLNVKSRDRVSVFVAFLPLIALPAAVLWPLPAAAGAAGALLLLPVLNAGLFRFLRRRRGVLFALAAVPAHWLYLLTCGLGFGLGLLAHLVGRGR